MQCDVWSMLPFSSIVLFLPMCWSHGTSQKSWNEEEFMEFQLEVLRSFTYFRKKFAYQIVSRDFILFKKIHFSFQKLIILVNSSEVLKFYRELNNYKNLFICGFLPSQNFIRNILTMHIILKTFWFSLEYIYFLYNEVNVVQFELI